MAADPVSRVDGSVVVVPFVAGMLRVATVDAVLDYGGPARFERLDPRDPYGYARLFARLWDAGEGFTIVEQDVVPPPGALAALACCSGLWCGHRLPCGADPLAYTFGLVRFAGGLLRAFPDLGRRIAGRGRPRRVSVPWNALDIATYRQLVGRGLTWHEHTPPATHLHAYKPAKAAQRG